MKPKIVLFTSLGALLSLFGCDYVDDRLTIRNDSSLNIYVAVMSDTVLSLGENDTFMFEDKFVPRFSKKKLLLMGKGGNRAWEYLPGDTLRNELHVFILLEETVRMYKPNEIIDKNLFAKRIDVSINDLNDSNWQISFENK